LIQINYKYLYTIALWITAIGLAMWAIDKVLYFNNIYFNYSDRFHHLAHILLSGTVFIGTLSILLYIFKIHNKYLHFLVSIISVIGSFMIIVAFEFHIGEQNSGTTDRNLMDSFYDFIGIVLIYLWLMITRKYIRS